MNKKIDWGEGEISQFLIGDFIKGMAKTGNYGAQNFINDSFKLSSQKYHKYRIIMNLADCISGAILKLKPSSKSTTANKKILFDAGGKYSSIVLEAKKFQSVEMIAISKNDHLFAIKNLIKYTNYTDLNQYVYNYLVGNGEKHLFDLVDKIKKRIIKVNPDYIVLYNDFLPIERAIVLASRELGIATVVIQHGVHNSSTVAIDGLVADHLFVWGRYFKDIHIKNSGRRPEDIYVLGYPYTIKTVENKINRPYVVYYLGQNFERYNHSKELLDVKIKTVGIINKICGKLGMEFVYRPHPGDDVDMLKRWLSQTKFSSKGESLEMAFEKGGVFISHSSTSLIEAAIRSRISIQLINLPVPTYNFEKIGACGKSISDINELEDYLTKIAKSQNINEFRSSVNENYIKISNNPGWRFLELLNEIDIKSHKS